MSTLGFIGSGNVGAALARLAVGAGHQVVLSNARGPQTLGDVVAALGPEARAATPAEAASAAEIVVVSIPFGAHQQLPVEHLRGKVVIDTTNYNPERDGAFPQIDSGARSTGELIQAHLPGSFVVKAFSNIFFKHLATLGRPAGRPGRSALPIAGDEEAAKAAVAALIDSIGFDVLDAGPLAECRRWAFGTPANHAYLDPDGRFAAPGRPASANDLAGLLAAFDVGL